ncbi:MAG: hypothetical protein ACRDSR_26805 [Pseudonocardiaceae bacterium]
MVAPRSRTPPADLTTKALAFLGADQARQRRPSLPNERNAERASLDKVIKLDGSCVRL